jgi:hypothetical protein
MMTRQERRAAARDAAKKLNMEGLPEAPEGKKENPMEAFARVVSGLALRTYSLDKRVQRLYTRAQKSDWRSSALMKILHDKGIISYEDVAEAANFVQQKELDQEIELVCKQQSLEDAPQEDEAQKGYYAIVKVDFVKDDQKLEGETVKAMVQLGQYELFPELDDAVLGMKTGESKVFGLEVMNQTDSASVELIGLKRPRGSMDGKTKETKVSET